METKLFVVIVYVAMSLTLFGLGLAGIVIARPQIVCQGLHLVHITTWEYTMAYIQLCCGCLMLLSTIVLLSVFKRSQKSLTVTNIIITLSSLVTICCVAWAIVGSISIWNYDMHDCREALFNVYVITHIMIIVSFLLPLAPIVMILYKINHVSDDESE